jgi:hypothetical protein
MKYLLASRGSERLLSEKTLVYDPCQLVWQVKEFEG